MPLSPGTRLGPYEILSPIGVGGMGEVYRARDSKLQRDVTIKVLPESVAGDPDTLARFERDALAVASLSHPNILAIHDFGTHEGTAYAVMELLEGETLLGKLATGPIPQRQAVDYALQIAKGLSAAHERGIVHRDLKPENLFVARDGRLRRRHCRRSEGQVDLATEPASDRARQLDALQEDDQDTQTDCRGTECVVSAHRHGALGEERRHEPSPRHSRARGRDAAGCADFQVAAAVRLGDHGCVPGAVGDRDEGGASLGRCARGGVR
jgi:serine/threonine protein kinase